MSTEATGDSKPNATGAIGAAAGTEAAELTATAVDVPAADELVGDGPADDGPAAVALAAPLADEVPRPGPASDDPALTEVPATEDAPAVDGALVVEEILTANDGLVTRLSRRVGARGLRARRRASRAGNDSGDGGPTEAVKGSAGDGEAESVGEPQDVKADEASTASEPGSRAEPGDDNRPDELNDADQPDEAADQFDEAEEPGEGYESYEVYEEYEEYAEYEVYEPEAEADGDAEAGSGTGPQRGRRWPRVLLGLGFVVLAAAIVGGAVAIVGSLTHGFKKPVKITYKSSPVFSLKTGDCFNPRGQQAYTLIACDSPHQAEVFATFALTGASWPGNAVVQAKASDGCASRLTGYVNPQLAISLSSTYVYPDTIAWQAGTRTVICEVRATSGELTGSVRGSTASSG